MKSILFLSFLIFLGACGASSFDTVRVPESPATGALEPQADYRIQAGDQLDIKFFYNNELNESGAVRPDGRISLQLLGQIKVNDMIPAELENLLKEQYAPHLATPEVAVIVRSFNMHKVFVDGYVVKPGTLSMVGYMTVMQAISQAGGLRVGSREEEILVIRRSDQGKPVVLRVNLAKAMSGEDMSQDIYLAPFDVVFVPRSAIGDVNHFVDLYIRRNLPINAGVGFSVP